MAQTVQHGPYFGFTASEIDTELERYKDAVKKATHGPGGIQSASINGRSFSYGNGRGWSLEEWQAEIQDAQAQVDNCVTATSTSTVYAAR